MVPPGDVMSFDIEMQTLSVGQKSGTFVMLSNDPDGSPLEITLVGEVFASEADRVLIPAGSFQMGDSFNEVFNNEQPVHTVTLDAFFIARYEVTNQEYALALNWALEQGNLITVLGGVVYKYNAGTSFRYSSVRWGPGPYQHELGVLWNGSFFDVVAGQENHPVVGVSWWGAAAYANWRSGMEDRQLCYDRIDETPPNWDCNFEKSGYRLPTEAEWERAARGGATGHRFPWSDMDTIQHARANYSSWFNYPYDTSPTSGPHPTFAVGNIPYTSPVGYFAPNGYELYDMAGNVAEWVNDWFSSDYYSTSPGLNPRGPSSGPLRVYRGGSWDHTAFSLRCSDRYSIVPELLALGLGIRLVSDSE